MPGRPRSHHDAGVDVADLIAVFVQPIDSGLHLFQDAGLTDRFHDADNRVPVALVT